MRCYNILLTIHSMAIHSSWSTYIYTFRIDALARVVCCQATEQRSETRGLVDTLLRNMSLMTSGRLGLMLFRVICEQGQINLVLQLDCYIIPMHMTGIYHYQFTAKSD